MQVQARAGMTGGGASGFSRFVAGLAASLRARRILYLGCHDAGDLAGFPRGADVCAITRDPGTLERAVEEHPSFAFRQGDPLRTPYGDGRFDFVFARNLLGGAGGGGAGGALGEMHRISSKYIASFEAGPGAGGGRPGRGAEVDEGRGAGARPDWLGFRVMVISDVQMHQDIDPARPWFTLVRKLR